MKTKFHCVGMQKKRHQQQESNPSISQSTIDYLPETKAKSFQWGFCCFWLDIHWDASKSPPLPPFSRGWSLFVCANQSAFGKTKQKTCQSKTTNQPTNQQKTTNKNNKKKERQGQINPCCWTAMQLQDETEKLPIGGGGGGGGGGDTRTRTESKTSWIKKNYSYMKHFFLCASVLSLSPRSSPPRFL